jgi:amino acid transporter
MVGETANAAATPVTTPSETNVFARKSSGLVKELGPFESFSINLINLGPGPAFALFLTILVFVPGVNLMDAVLLGALVGAPVVAMYAFLAVEMPRSGGEYIYSSRLLHPYFGLVASLSRLVNGIIYAAILPFWFSTLILGPGLAGWGSLTANVGMTNIGNALTLFSPTQNNMWIIAIGEILTIALTALYVFLKPRVAFSLFSALLLVELLGLIVSLGLLIGVGHSGFVSAVNGFMATQGYHGNYYQAVASYGASTFGGYGTDIGNTIIFVPLVFAFYYMFTGGPNYIAGEFQRASRSVRLGLALSYGLAISFAVAIVLVFENVVGMNFLNGSVWISTYFLGGATAPPPMPFASGLTSLPLFAAHGNNTLIGVMFLGSVSWYIAWLILAFYYFSRYSLSMSLDRLFPRWMSAVNRRSHSPYMGIIVISVFGGILIPVVAYDYTSAYYPLVYLLFFLPMISVSLSGLSLLRLGVQKKRTAFMVVGTLAFLATAASAYLVSTLPLLGSAAGFTLSNQTTSYVTIVAILVGSAIWYWAVRGYTIRRHGIDVALAFKQLPPD